MPEKDLLEPVKNWLVRQGLTTLEEMRLCESYCDVVGVNFGLRVSRRIPELYRTVAVELKLRNIAGVLSQAEGNQRYVDESYAAMPSEFVSRMQTKTIRKFTRLGIGLLGVGEDVNFVLEARINTELEWPRRTKNKLWRRYRQKQKLSQKPDGGKD